MTSRVDTNVSNYTIEELMAIVEVSDLDAAAIKTKINRLVERFKQSKPELVVFFNEIQKRLLKQIDDDKNNDNKRASKLTSIKKIDDEENDHNEIPREKVNLNSTYQVPVKQDNLNPTLKNTIARFVNLDSQFRQYTSGIESSACDYTLDLSDTLKDVLSLRLYSYQIPFSWYIISENNNTLWITNDDTQNVAVSVVPGNYSASQFQTALNDAFVATGFTFPPVTSPPLAANKPVYYNPNNGKITLFLDGGAYTGDPSFNITTATQITFFDFDGRLHSNKTCVTSNNNYMNNTLGWIMGYRAPFVVVEADGNRGAAVLDLNGTKYLILVIDDYNQNHVNNGLVTITELSSVLKLPAYYSQDLPYTCLEQQISNLSEIYTSATAEDNSNGLLTAGKYKSNYIPTQVILPSAPRTLTQSQIYTINEIIKNRNNNTNYLFKAPTSSDILAIVPIKTGTSGTGSLLVEFGSSLQNNIRTYFGPVNIERMCVKLLDDKGNLINLNGVDWCCTLICECLYKY